jgi:bifunctional lysine-specific demethylase and histidyl-hydroxylase NO66
MSEIEATSEVVEQAVEFLTGGTAPLEFLDHHFGVQPLLGTTPRSPGPLYGLGDLNDALNTEEISFPRLRLVREGKVLPETLYYTQRPGMGAREERDRPAALNTDAVITQMRDGATLVVSRVDTQSAALAAQLGLLEVFFDERVTVNAYLSMPGVPGLALHYDSHDVFILQLSGEKDWEVFRPTLRNPTEIYTRNSPSKPDGAAVVERRLTPGNTLYIPRGWLHRAEAVDQPSLHLTFTLARKNYASMIADTALFATARERLREDLPLLRDLENSKELAREVSDRLAGVNDLSALRSYLRRLRDAAIPRPRFALPDLIGGRAALDTDTPLAWVPPRAVHLEEVQAKSTISFTSMGKRWTLPADARGLLDFARRTRFFTIGDAVSGCRSDRASDQAILDQLTDLLDRGLVTIDQRAQYRWARYLRDGTTEGP